ncbi:MAG: TetR/AcrR family transcriptional regulator [Actinomycetota bacterium]
MSAHRPIGLRDRLRTVPAPPPVLSREREARLTDRQREILDELGRIFDKGFADVTMAELASQLNCSLRTLYGLASGRNELVMMVVDRSLRDVGRSARQAIRDDMRAIDAIRAYLAAATVAVQDTTPEFAGDMASIDEGIALNAAHSAYIIDVARTLLDVAVERREIAPVDTAAVAQMIAGLGATFAQPAVMATLASSPKDAADAMVEVVLTGLERGMR